jgi:hypothetical protein
MRNYLFINQSIVICANKAVAGNLRVQSDIFSLHRAFKEQICERKQMLKFSGCHSQSQMFDVLVFVLCVL